MGNMSGRYSGAELAVLFHETVALYHRLTAAAAAIHGEGRLSGPRRTLLVALAASGPQTVARLAAARAESRQRLQPLVNALIADGLVAAAANPAHRRSPLMFLTAAGRRQVERIARTEGELRARLTPTSSPRAIAAAAGVLRDVRQTIEGQLPQALAVARKRSRRGPRSSRRRA
jgi:DNA-binding MarR family transcriptional regulator